MKNLEREDKFYVFAKENEDNFVYIGFDENHPHLTNSITDAKQYKSKDDIKKDIEYMNKFPEMFNNMKVYCVTLNFSIEPDFFRMKTSKTMKKIDF